MLFLLRAGQLQMLESVLFVSLISGNLFRQNFMNRSFPNGPYLTSFNMLCFSCLNYAFSFPSKILAAGTSFMQNMWWMLDLIIGRSFCRYLSILKLMEWINVGNFDLKSS